MSQAPALRQAVTTRALDRRALFGCLAVAVLVRAAWWVLNVSIIENEGVEYATIARTWFSGEGYLGILGGREVMFPPLYSMLIGGLNWVTGDLPSAARVVSLGAGLGLVAVSYALANRLFGKPVGLIAGAIAACHPLLVAFSVSTYSEPLAFFLVLLAPLLAIEAGSTGRWSLAAASGISIGLAYLTRPETIAFIGIVALFLVCERIRRGAGWRPACGLAGLAVSATALVALPYVIHLSRIAGRPLLEGKTPVNEVVNARLERGMTYPEASNGLDVAGDFDAHAPNLGGPGLWGDQSVFLHAASDSAPAAGLTALFHEIPTRVQGAFRLAREAILEWGSIRRIPLGLLAMIIGAVATGWWRADNLWPGVMLLAFVGLQAAFLLGVMFLWTRYGVPLVVLTIPWTAGGIAIVSRAAGRLFASSSRRWSTATAGVLVLAICAGSYKRVLAFDDLRQTRDTELRETGQWIREQAATAGGARKPREHLRIMGYSAVIPFYAGGFLDYLPYTRDVERALAYVHWKAPDFIVIRASEVDRTPYSAAWLQDGIPDKCAVPIRRLETPSGQIQIWRWCAD